MNRGYHNALKSFPWVLLIGTAAGCSMPPLATPAHQTQQIQIACQVAMDADNIIVAGPFSATVKTDAQQAMTAIRPVCDNPNAQYSDALITAMLEASVKLANDTKQ